MLEAPRVGRLTKERVAALGIQTELREVGAAENDRARLAQQGDQRGVARGGNAAAAGDAERRALAFEVEIFLYRNR